MDPEIKEITTWFPIFPAASILAALCKIFADRFGPIYVEERSRAAGIEFVLEFVEGSYFPYTILLIGVLGLLWFTCWRIENSKLFKNNTN